MNKLLLLLQIELENCSNWDDFDAGFIAGLNRAISLLENCVNDSSS